MKSEERIEESAQPDPRPKAECTWCSRGHRQRSELGDHVALFVCVREHMLAIPLCRTCATVRARVGETFYCRDCIDTGIDRSADDPLCTLELLTTRADWMEQIEAGRIRFLPVAAPLGVGTSA